MRFRARPAGCGSRNARRPVYRPHRAALDHADLCRAPGRRPGLFGHGRLDRVSVLANDVRRLAGRCHVRGANDRGQDAAGQWHIVHGNPVIRPVCRGVRHCPGSATPACRHSALRLTTNQEIYWDRLAIVWSEPLPDCAAPTVGAAGGPGVRSRIFARMRRPTVQQRPDYLYQQRSPLWYMRHPSGFYTSFGPAPPLVRDVDDAPAIMGPGGGDPAGVCYAVGGPGNPAGGAAGFANCTAGARTWISTRRTAKRLPRRHSREPQTGRSTAVRYCLHELFNQRYQAGF